MTLIHSAGIGIFRDYTRQLDRLKRPHLVAEDFFGRANYASMSYQFVAQFQPPTVSSARQAQRHTIDGGVTITCRSKTSNPDRNAAHVAASVADVAVPGNYVDPSVALTSKCTALLPGFPNKLRKIALNGQPCPAAVGPRAHRAASASSSRRRSAVKRSPRCSIPGTASGVARVWPMSGSTTCAARSPTASQPGRVALRGPGPLWGIPASA